MSISSLISKFTPISLAEMDSVKLMNRVDTKYVASLAMLPAILQAARTDYFAQEVNGKRIASYDTMYYDTETLDMYMRHHDRQLVRQKIRIRQYLDTGQEFLEVKKKNNKGRTKKKRIALPVDEATIADFIEQKSRYSWATIAPHLRTAFHRITLVNKAKTERLTIDLDLVWENVLTGEKKTYPELVIIELKRDGNAPSQMTKIMLNQHIKPLKISKYCIGTALTTPGLKRNRFKAKIRRIEKLLKSEN